MGCNGLKQILTDFSGWTSAHGVPHIGSAQNKYLRFFWTLITFASMCLFMYQMYTLVEKYLSYSTSVQTELKFEKRNFPAITLCHLNPVKRTMVNTTENGFYRLNTTYTSVRNASEGGENNAELTPDYSFIVGAGNTTYEVQNMKMANIFSAMYVNNYEYGAGDSADIGDTPFEDISYSKDDLIMSCAYNTKACVDGDFETKFDPRYGQCHTFNGGGNSSRKLYESTRAGPLYGLRIMVRLHQPDYMSYIMSSAMRVAVHGQDAEPFVDSFGYNAAPGFATSFGIKYVETIRKSEPYGDCLAQGTGAYFFNGGYIVEGCARSCLNNAIFAACDCYDPTLGDQTKVNEAAGGEATMCSDGDDAFKAAKLLCSETIKKEFDVISSCDCPQTCTEASYTATVSTALWPSKVYSPPECNNQTLTERYWLEIDKCADWYKENTLLIEAYYERMNYQTMSEVADYSVVNLISDTGGQLGLWLGVSFITCVEFCSMCALLCCYGASRKQAPTGKAAHDDSSEVESVKTKKSTDDEDDSTDSEDPYNAANAEGGDNMPPPVAE